MNPLSEEGSLRTPDRSRMLPIAEDFHSLQGEGCWVGTPMHFVRTAGCSVGRSPVLLPTPKSLIPMLKTGAQAWECGTYDGRPFWCDTDFGLKEWTNFANLLDDTWEGHICITGGEPLIHQERLVPFAQEAWERGLKLHLETSGTIQLVADLYHALWVSVSPKQGVLPEMLEEADEIKLLVDAEFDLEKVPAGVLQHPLVYVQPVNGEMSLNRQNFQLCMEILRIRPDWHMSVQTHKLVGLR